LGDPQEMSAILAALLDADASGGGCSSSRVLAVSSAKSNVAHTELAAGLTGLLKLLVQHATQTTAPNAQLRVRNRHLSSMGMAACALPLQLSSSTSSTAPTASASLAGGVSSFGWSGTIAHAVAQTASASPYSVLACHPRQDRLLYTRSDFPWLIEPHPLLGKRQPSCSSTNDPAAVLFQTPVLGALSAVVSDHVIMGRVLFPAAGYLEVAHAACVAAAAAAGGGGAGVAAAAAQRSALLQNVFFMLPLPLSGGSDLALSEARLECSLKPAEATFEVTSVNAASGDASTHCTGDHGAGEELVRMPSLRVESSRTRCARSLDGGLMYDGFFAAGSQYGPAFRTLDDAWNASSGPAFATSRLTRRLAHQGTHVHPADLDGALQLASSAGQKYGLPFAINAARLRGIGRVEQWTVRARARHQPPKRPLPSSRPSLLLPPRPPDSFR
jgi:acyl transferase domain-containing protein